MRGGDEGSKNNPFYSGDGGGRGALLPLTF